MAKVYKRSGSPFYYLSYKNANGKRIRESSGVEEKKLALEVAEKKQEEAWQQRKLDKKPTHLWEEAVLKYKRTTTLKKNSEKTLDGILRWVDPHLRGKPVHLVTEEVCEKLADQKKEEGAKPATINTMLGRVRTILKGCVAWKWIDKTPKIKLKKEPPSRVRWERPEAIQYLLTKCAAHQRNPILFSLSTGLRKANVAGIKKTWINKRHWFMTIPGEYYKNGEPHTVPLNKVARQIIEEEWHKHPVYLFTYQGKQVKELNTKAFRKALKAAGIEDFRWHDLRHTWASWMAQNGENPLLLMEAGGWRDMRSVKRYAHLSKEHLKGAAERLADSMMAQSENKDEDKKP